MASTYSWLLQLIVAKNASQGLNRQINHTHAPPSCVQKVEEAALGRERKAQPTRKECQDVNKS